MDDLGPRPDGLAILEQTQRTTPPDRVATWTFLFTDIEGSTRLWERLPRAMGAALTRHDALLRTCVEGAGGRVVKTTGDGLMAVFTSVRDGLEACLAAQLALIAEPWGETGPLRVRMGLHAGEAASEGGDFHGPAVNRAARIMAAGHGGQVLLSATVASLAGDRLPVGASLEDLGEHRLKDLSIPERVFQLTHPELQRDFPQLVTLDPRLAALPGEPSLFVGREAELAGIGERLSDPAIRLLTLVGPGGIGKTRLALRSARQIQARFSGGAVFVDLSAARDTGGVIGAIGRAIGLVDSTEELQLRELTARLAGRSILLVLDNFEQVAASAPTLAQLIEDCPALRLLVTSREALRVRGEHVWPVPPLTTPGASFRPSTAVELSSFEAVQLFVERARAVRPDFRVTDDNAAVLVEICRRLDGLPLAIELATARLRVFSLESLRDRLGSRLQLLSGGARDLPERHQTLRATIEWSYQLLPPSEQRLFELLGCFAWASVEAVETVAGGLAGWLDGLNPIDGLASLVDKSLIRERPDARGEPRFEMLGSVREFASERLNSSPDLAAATRRAHAGWYAELAGREARLLGGPERGPALARLAEELEDLRAAWRWSVETGDLDRLTTLLDALWPLCDSRGWHRALHELAGEMLAVLDAAPPTPQRTATAATLRTSQARALMMMQGFTTEVEAAFERALEALEGSAARESFPVLRVLASLAGFRGEHERAGAIGRQILDLGERLGDPSMQVDGYQVLGASAAFSGRLAEGIELLELGIRWFTDNPYRSSHLRLGPDPRVVSLGASSLLHWWRGLPERSLERSDQAVVLAQSLDHPPSLAHGLFHAGLLRLWRGEPDRALERALHVQEVADVHDLHIWGAVGMVLQGATDVARGELETGTRLIEEGVNQYRDLRTPPVFWPFLRAIQAVALARSGRPGDGLTVIDESISLNPSMPDFQLTRGDLLLAQGGTAATGGARASYEQAAGMSRYSGALLPELQALVRLERLGASGDDLQDAERLSRLAAVAATFSEDVAIPDVIEARALLASRPGSPL